MFRTNKNIYFKIFFLNSKYTFLVYHSWITWDFCHNIKPFQHIFIFRFFKIYASRRFKIIFILIARFIDYCNSRFKNFLMQFIANLIECQDILIKLTIRQKNLSKKKKHCYFWYKILNLRAHLSSLTVLYVLKNSRNRSEVFFPDISSWGNQSDVNGRFINCAKIRYRYMYR